MKTDIFTVCACWDGGNYYPVEYVNILFNSIYRNTSIPFEFVLYVGPEAENNPNSRKINNSIRIIKTNLPYWWSGMNAWALKPKGVNTETVLYMDLDQVIVGNLDDIINYDSNHCYMKDYPAYCCPKGKENDGNATVSLIRNGSGHHVWDEYVKAGCPIWSPLKPPKNRLFPLAAQGIMNDSSVHHDVFPEAWVASYKLWVLKFGIPDGCKSVSFHGKPKPHEITYVPFIKENWR